MTPDDWITLRNLICFGGGVFLGIILGAIAGLGWAGATENNRKWDKSQEAHFKEMEPVGKMLEWPSDRVKGPSAKGGAK